MVRKIVFLALFVLASCVGQGSERETVSTEVRTITSPDGNLQLDFSLDDSGRPVYALGYKGREVIHGSRMGFELAVLPSFSQGFSVAGVAEASVDTTWTPVWGENAKIRDRHNELLVSMVQTDTGRKLDLRFRVFDDGLGFRYEFPVQPDLRHFVIKDEVTEFRLTGDHKAWWMPADFDTNEFPTTTSPLSAVAGLIDGVRQEPLAAKATAPGVAVQTPLMLKSADGLYINIHEAALVDFPAMHLSLNDGAGGASSGAFSLSALLAPDKNGNRGYIQTGSVSPWRTVIVSDDARDILASNLILNLNEPCDFADTSWIRPVKYIGVWWEYFIGGGSTWAYTDTQDIVIGRTDYATLKPNGHHGANTAHVKEYIDFAAANGFDAVLVEGWNEGWEDNWAYLKERIYSFTDAYPDFDVAALRDYAAARGVGIIMHHETTSSVVDYMRQLPDALRFMNDNGYTAVKTGYVGPIIPRSEYHDGQWMVNHYIEVARQAAAHRVMVDSHEAVRPTGLCRTYPNWLAQESARGTEFESFNGNTPDHTVVLPFTRLVGGPMDYTPGIFQGDLSVYGANTARLSTTLAGQLALYVTMYSPLQMAADLIENYRRFPDAFQFIKDVAVDWDATYVLEAEPGDHVTVARKAKGTDEWFVGGKTDENAREATIDFGFLPAGRSYVATIYADGPDAGYRTRPQSYAISKKQVTSGTVLRQRLAPGGGVAISVK